jgi:hypothetical protein
MTSGPVKVRYFGDSYLKVGKPDKEGRQQQKFIRADDQFNAWVETFPEYKVKRRTFHADVTAGGETYHCIFVEYHETRKLVSDKPKKKGSKAEKVEKKRRNPAQPAEKVRLF